MKIGAQTTNLLLFSLLSLRARAVSVAVLCLGIAGVVGVFIIVFAMSVGYRASMSGTASEDRMLLLASGSDSELASVVRRAALQELSYAPGLKKDARGSALVSPESLSVLNIVRKDGSGLRVKLRGVTDQLQAVKPELTLQQGRWFASSVRELVIGESLLKQYPALGLGSTLSTDNGQWTIVGVFEGLHESELLGGLETVLSAYRRTHVQSATVLVENTQSTQALKEWLSTQPTLGLIALTEAEYTANQSKSLEALLQFLATVVTAIMAVGACFVALNTMYAAIDARSKEIATLRAIGFERGAVILAILAEAVTLALVGALIGAILAIVFWSGSTMTTNASGSTVHAFELRIDAFEVLTGIALACVVGLVGGFMPALRASSRQPATVLRSQ